jgi:pimeloyl-ACP methyl ester carboxylesterase
MQVTSQDGVRLAVEVTEPTATPPDASDRLPVLLLHGWPDTHRLWRHQVAALTAAGHRTIAPDLRGFGDSDKPEDVSSYEVAHHIADLIAILDALDVEKVALVGHDWGAAVAWSFAAYAPERVDRLVSLTVGHPQSFMGAGLTQKLRSLYMVLFNVPVVAEQFLGQFGRQFLATHPDRDEVLEQLARPGAATASLGIYRANASPKTIVSPPAPLPPITCPVTGVLGSKDIALTEAQMVGSAEYVSGPWRYVRLEGAGHWLPLEVPDVIDELLIEAVSPGQAIP